MCGCILQPLQGPLAGIGICCVVLRGLSVPTMMHLVCCCLCKPGLGHKIVMLAVTATNMLT